MHLNCLVGPLISVMVLVGCAKAPDRNKDFPTFWTEFRAAALAGEIDRLAAMTRFPLEIKGPLDDDPTGSLALEEFAAAIERVLEQDSGEQAEPETVHQFLERTVAPTQQQLTDTRARVGDFVFGFGEGRWQLVRLYLAESE